MMEGKEERFASEEEKTVARYEKIVDRAHKEIENVRSVYKWLAAALTIIFLAGIGIGAYLFSNSLTELKAQMRKDAEFLKKGSEIEIDLVRKEIINRIDKEFDRENIRSFVEEKIKERVEKVADQLISKQISDRMNPKIEKLEYQLNDAKNSFSSSRKDLEQKVIAASKEIGALNFKLANVSREFQMKGDFTMTVIRAQNNDRGAFDRLKVWSKDKTFFMAKEAEDAWIKVLNDHAPMIVGKGAPISWKEGTDPSKFTISDLKSVYEAAPSYRRPQVIEYTWGRSDFSKRERLSFLVGILEKENDLVSVEYAGRFFAEGAGLKLKPLAIDEFLMWWRENREKIKD